MDPPFSRCPAVRYLSSQKRGAALASSLTTCLPLPARASLSLCAAWLLSLPPPRSALYLSQSTVEGVLAAPHRGTADLTVPLRLPRELRCGLNYEA